MKVVSENEMVESFKQFPTLEQLQQQLNELVNATTKGILSLEEISKVYYEKAVVLPHSVSTFDKQTINLLKVFRV